MVGHIRFNDRRTISQLSYSMWQADTAENTAGKAPNAGRRHTGTAAIYGNDAGVRRAHAVGLAPFKYIRNRHTAEYQRGYMRPPVPFDYCTHAP